MLDTLVAGEAISRAQFNDSLAKQRHAFPKTKRFQKKLPSFVTEFDINLSNNSVCKKTHNRLKDQSFFAVVKTQTKKKPDPRPDFGTYNPKLLRPSKSVPFSIGRDVG